ncbi:MAG: subtilase [Prevotellaceae bacterium]|nr:subtilase [Prevotellaceae bacterium]
MKRKMLCLSLLMALSGGSVFADTEQTVTIDGSVIDNFVVNLTFNGNAVTLDYSDGSSQTVDDMSTVGISLTYDSSSGITNVNAEDNVNVDNRVYTLAGQFVGTSVQELPKGIYIVGGKKYIVK